MFEEDFMIDDTLTLREKNQIWPLITQHFGIDPIKCGSQGRSEVEAALGEIAIILNPNRPQVGDSDKIYRLENIVEEYEKLVEELSASTENMDGLINKAMNKIRKNKNEEDY